MSKYNKNARRQVYRDLLDYIDSKETEFKLNQHNVYVIGPKDKVQKDDNKDPFILSIVNADTLDATMDVISKNELKTGFIVMASEKHAGGGVVNGALAQEEDVARRCDITGAYDKVSYPLKQFETVVVDKLKILCKNESKSYSKLKEPIEAVGLLAPAFRNPKLIDKYDYEKYRTGMKKKIKVLLNAALYAKCENVVLGAWGCGAFHNPPREVAECFRDVLRKYRYKFKTVVFAILDNRGTNNREIFESVLEQKGAFEDTTSFLPPINKKETKDKTIKSTSKPFTYADVIKKPKYVKTTTDTLESLSDILNKL